jgi:hypothetical protein
VAQYGKHIESPPYILATKRKAFSFHIKTNEMLSEPINAFSFHKKTSEMLSELVNAFLLGHIGWGQRLNFKKKKKNPPTSARKQISQHAQITIWLKRK